MPKEDPLGPDKLDHARRLARLAFRGLSPQEAYDLAFYGHFLTSDPLGRVPTFLGTNQRDTIRPAIERTFRDLPDGGLVVDLAAGDGATVLPAVPPEVEARFVLVEPSPEAVGDYLLAIEEAPNLEMAALPLAVEAGGIEGNPVWHEATEGGIDLALYIHGIYFLDVPRVLKTLYRGLRPGGTILIVYADERRGLTGAAIDHHLRRTGRDDQAQEFQARLRARDLLLSSEVGPGTTTDLLQSAGEVAPVVTVDVIESAAFAPTLQGLSAIGLISGLSYIGEEHDGPMDETKASSLIDVLAHDPERLQFGVVDDPDDPRCGHFRASQPQRVVAIRRPVGN